MSGPLADLKMVAESTATDIWVRVVPGAQKDGLVGIHAGLLRIRVAAPPHEGAANARLVCFLARDVFDVARSKVEIIRGQSARTKRVRIHAAAPVIQAALCSALSGAKTSVK